MYLLKMSHCVETVKWLDYNQYSQLRLDGAVETYPLWVQEVPGSIPSYVKGFYAFVLLLLCFYFFVQKHIICHKSLQFLL